MLLAFLAALTAQPLPATRAPDALAPLASPAASGTPSGTLEGLEQKLKAIAAVPKGDFGIAVMDLGTGQSLSVNGDRLFPMASTVKVAIAATFLADVDAGRRSLTDLIPVDDKLRLRADGITTFAPHPGVTLSAANIIELMLVRSDNTATDVMLNYLGGPAVVQAWLERNRLSGLRVDRNIAQLLLARRGLTAKPAAAAMVLRRWDPVEPGVVAAPDAENDNSPPSPTFDADPRDSATPVAFAELLRRLHSTELLKPVSRDWLFSVMRRCITGSNRIKGLLPKGTTVEHKTGTYSTITDDVGYINLPDGRRIVVAAFARGGANRSTLIARASKAIYDTFVNLR